jgi:hypothetical protein
MKRCLPLLLSLLAVAVPATAGAATFGAEVGSVFTNQVRGEWSPTKVMNSLESLYKAGGRVGRADSDWGITEPKAPVGGNHRFDWAYDDLVVSEMASAHLRWEPTLAFAPRWAEGHRSNVLHLSSGRAIAYLPPAHNARMYEVIRNVVHRAYPHARVLTGGLAWTESSLPRLLKAFRGKILDAVAIHPYAATPGQTIKVATDALADMRQYGRGGTPVSANEYGWTSRRNTWGSTNPSHVKTYAYQALIGLAKLRLFEIMPFLWGDPSWGLNTGSFASALAKITHHQVAGPATSR